MSNILLLRDVRLLSAGDVCPADWALRVTAHHQPAHVSQALILTPEAGHLLEQS